MEGWPCEGKSMFGGRSYFSGGNMFVGVHGDNLVMRLPDDERAEFLGGTQRLAYFEPAPGRAMREYVTVPADLLADDEALDGWLRRSLAYAESLPFKEPKPRRPRKKD